MALPEDDFPTEFEALVQLVWLHVPLSSCTQADLRSILNALMTGWKDENPVAKAYDLLSFEVTKKRAVEEMQAHVERVAARQAGAK